MAKWIYFITRKEGIYIMENWVKRLVFELNICPYCSTESNHIKLEPDGPSCWLCRSCGELFGVCSQA